MGSRARRPRPPGPPDAAPRPFLRGLPAGGPEPAESGRLARPPLGAMLMSALCGCGAAVSLSLSLFYRSLCSELRACDANGPRRRLVVVGRDGRRDHAASS